MSTKRYSITLSETKVLNLNKQMIEAGEENVSVYIGSLIMDIATGKLVAPSSLPIIGKSTGLNKKSYTLADLKDGLPNAKLDKIQEAIDASKTPEELQAERAKHPDGYTEAEAEALAHYNTVKA